MSCKECEEKKQDEEEQEEKKEKIRNRILFIFGTICLIIAITLQKLDPTYGDISWNMFADSAFYSSYAFIAFLLYTIGYLPLLAFTVKEQFEEIEEGNIINEATLMIVATASAYGINEYPEALFVLLFALVGEMLEDYATGKSKSSIAKLINNMPLYAHLKKEDGTFEDKNPEEIPVGSLLEIRPGEKVPIDGTIVEGKSSLDLSSLNGESLPRDVKEGEEIYSGSVNLSSVLLIKTSKAYQDSTLAKILDLVKNEQAKKAKTEKFISRFAKIYTPVVMLIALVVFLMGYGLSGWSWVNGGRVWLYKAASVLLIACPCALVIGVPLVFFSGIGAGSKLGVLIKGSVSLENLAKSNTFVFDKTGTLTKGNFVLENKPDPKMLQIAASLEAKSTHPLAKAIQKANKESLLEVTDFTNVTGYGIKGKIDGKEYLIGTKKFLLESGIPDFKEEETPFKVLYLGEAGKSYLASFIVRDEVKREAKDSLAALKANKVKRNIILSGDDKKIVSKVGEEVGADITYGELLPEEKLQALESKKKEGAKICYVGDGINDSPALLAADVGLAMGALGSDAAIEASDIVVMDDDLRKVAEAKRLADHTMRIVYLTITVALLLKIMFLVLVLTGALGEWAMVVSGFSDTGILLLCVLIAMTPLLYKPKYVKKSSEKDCPSKKDKKEKELVASLSE